MVQVLSLTYIGFGNLARGLFIGFGPLWIALFIYETGKAQQGALGLLIEVGLRLTRALDGFHCGVGGNGLLTLSAIGVVT